MKNIFTAINDAYFILDESITKLLKSRINHDNDLQNISYFDMEKGIGLSIMVRNS